MFMNAKLVQKRHCIHTLGGLCLSSVQNNRPYQFSMFVFMKMAYRAHSIACKFLEGVYRNKFMYKFYCECICFEWKWGANWFISSFHNIYVRNFLSLVQALSLFLSLYWIHCDVWTLPPSTYPTLYVWFLCFLWWLCAPSIPSMVTWIGQNYFQRIVIM